MERTGAPPPPADTPLPGFLSARPLPLPTTAPRNCVCDFAPDGRLDQSGPLADHRVTFTSQYRVPRDRA